jgi:hypothetical protein
MRAIQPMHRRRGLAAGLVMTSVIALSILGGGTALAKAPTWPTGHGTDFQNPFPDSGASSTTVTAGKSVGFYEWLRNPGSSNISQLFMNVAISPGDQLGVKWTIKTDAGAVVRSGTCVINSMPLCSFGPLNAGQTVYVLAAFRVSPSSGPTQTLKLDFNSTGIPPGGNNSHGDDVFTTSLVQVTPAGDGDASGDFNFDQASLTVQNNPVGPGNTQQTSLSLFAPGFGAFVNDNPNLVAARCTNALIADIVVQNSWFSCKKLSSLTSLLEAGNGGTFTNPNGGPGIKVVVSFASAPSQLNGGHAFVYHVWTDATGDHAELITATCALDAAGFPTNQAPCLIVGTNSVTFWLTHNGNARM